MVLAILGSAACVAGTAVGNYPAADLSFTIHPVANGWDTKSTLSVEGRTSANTTREFLVNLGLQSSTGASAASTPYRDKVTLYAGMSAQAGTGDVWAINPLLTMEAGSGDNYTAQGIELDFNNNAGHRGEADGGAGLAPPAAYGLSVTGASKFRATSALLVCGGCAGPACGNSTHMWNRGITFANNAIAQSTFQELGSPQRSIDIRGSPGFGVFQENPASKNFFAGGTTVGKAGGWVQADASVLNRVEDYGGCNVSTVLAQLRVRRWGGGGLGLVAQEAEEVAPELVRAGAGGGKAVSYERLAALLLRGWQEEAARADALQQRVATLEAAAAATASRLAAIEKALGL